MKRRRHPSRVHARVRRGFTLIELLLVLVIIALLASIVAPLVTGSISRARESTLKEDLYALRKAIDDYYADNGVYPPELDELVKRRYLRNIPADPVTEKRDTWVLVRAEDDKGGKGGIVDVHSGSEEKAADGSSYKDW
ncbi:MAG: type II secretion system protein [Sulfurifustis sp.]